MTSPIIINEFGFAPVSIIFVEWTLLGFPIRAFFLSLAELWSFVDSMVVVSGARFNCFCVGAFHGYLSLT